MRIGTLPTLILTLLATVACGDNGGESSGSDGGSGGTASGGVSSGGTSTGGWSSGSTGGTGTGGAATGGASAGGTTSGGTTSGGTTSGGTTSGGTTSGGTPSGGTTTGGAPTGGVTSGGTSTGGTATGGTSTGGVATGGASTGGVSSGGTASGGAGPGTGRFYVVGKDIVGPDGKRFFPFGANVAASIVRDGWLERPYTFDFGGTANGHSDDALAWGWNTIRVNFVCHRPDGFTNPQTLAASATRIIEEYTAKGIVVMLECHDDTGQMLPLSDPKMQDAEEFWDLVIAQHKDNPYVWLNPFNEPTSNAGDAGQLAYWTELHRHYLDKRNAAGAENILVADVPGYGQGASAIADTDLGSNLVANACNVVVSWHTYGGSGAADVAQYETWIQHIQARRIALIFGEYGYHIDGTTPYPVAFENFVAATDAALNLGRTYGVGSLAWHGTGDSNYNILFTLMADYQNANGAAFWHGATGQGLSEMGQKVWNAGHAQPDLGTFTGSLADSHCPSTR